jgi:Rad3-related DNA helicase
VNPALPYTVAVRALCEFTAKTGDLDLRFTPSPTAEEGIAGHERVRRRRGAGWRSEVAVAGTWRSNGPGASGGGEHALCLQVRGRIDGWDPAAQRLEEVKTHRGPVDRIPENHRALHWAQAQVYGALLCAQQGLGGLEIAIVYLDVDSDVETPVTQQFSAAQLQAFFDAQCARFVAWAQQEAAHRAARNAALDALAWPFERFPEGQRTLATAVYNAARSGRCLLAQAPTGVGKTMGTLFPLLKAMPGQQLDKLYFLTAKTPGRQLALDAVAQLNTRAPLPLRVLELRSRDRACEHPDKACHGESCPLARGFYDRLPAARAAALAQREAGSSALREVARAHAVCPYYLGQELVRWADVVVGDYNHYFDHAALLHGLARANDWRVGVLVDEAHNLVDRARLMFTAELDPARFEAVRSEAPGALKRGFERLARAWRAWAKAPEQAHGAADTAGAGPAANAIDATEAPGPTAIAAPPAPANAFEVVEAPPPAWARALRELSAELGAWLADGPDAVPPGLLDWHFDALQFLRLLDGLGPHSQLDVQRRIQRAHSRSRVTALPCVRNIVPAPMLRDRFTDAHCAVLFSATLAPPVFHLDLLGLPENTAVLDVPSAFSREQLQVRIARGISTRYGDRDASLWPIAQRIAAQYDAAPGNYLAFFSSFDYLQQAADTLAALRPDVPQWRQQRGMGEAERAGFVARFAPEGRGIGFAVLGGAFGEGIDLPGSRLVGAFVATLGLPQVNEINEAMKARMAALFGDGWRYTYLYPGLQKVVQAAGRVIRGPGDRGVVHLIDDRFARAEVQALLPAWWGRPVRD